MRKKWGTFSVPVLLTALTWIIGFLSFCSFSNGAEESATGTPLTFPMDCRPYHQRGMKFLLKNFNKCSRELKANATTDKEYEDRIGCALKCTMRNTGYSENDIVTEETMRRAAGSILPKVLLDPLIHMLMRQCHSKYGALLDPNDPVCKSYSEYAFCIQSCIADIVESDDYEMYCIKHDKDKKKKS